MKINKENTKCTRCGRLVMKGEFLYKDYWISNEFVCKMCNMVQELYHEKLTNK